VHGPKSTHGLVAPAWPRGQIARTTHAGGPPARMLGTVTVPMASAVVRLPTARHWLDMVSPMERGDGEVAMTGSGGAFWTAVVDGGRRVMVVSDGCGGV
jgi:hypothetical protein